MTPRPDRWPRFEAALLTLSRWDVLRFGLLALAALLGYGALLAIPPVPADPVVRQSSWDRRDLPHEFTTGAVLDGSGLTWPEVPGDEPPLVPMAEVPGAISSKVED